MTRRSFLLVAIHSAQLKQVLSLAVFFVFCFFFFSSIAPSSFCEAFCLLKSVEKWHDWVFLKGGEGSFAQNIHSAVRHFCKVLKTLSKCTRHPCVRLFCLAMLWMHMGLVTVPEVTNIRSHDRELIYLHWWKHDLIFQRWAVLLNEECSAQSWMLLDGIPVLLFLPC